MKTAILCTTLLLAKLVIAPNTQRTNQLLLHKTATLHAAYTTSARTAETSVHAIFASVHTANAGRGHYDSIDQFVADDEALALPHALHILALSQQASQFSEDEEHARLLALGYLREKFLGRLSTQHSAQIESALVAHLQTSILHTQKDARLKKSLLGDKIEIMQWLAQRDLDTAHKQLSAHPYPDEIRYLNIGVENGRWLIGTRALD